MKKIFFFVVTLLLIASTAFGTVTAVVGKDDLKQYDGVTTTFTRKNFEGGTDTLNKIDFNGVDVLQVYGDGTTKTEVCLNSAKTSIGTTTRATLWLSAGTWVLSNNVDLSATKISVRLDKGALLTGTGRLILKDGHPYYLSWRRDLDDIVDDIGTVDTTLIIDESVTLGEDTTIPSTLTLEIPQGAIISDGGGSATLTINGPVVGPFDGAPYQVFAWTGSGKVSFGVQIREVFPELWGIDGTADEVQINQAVLSLFISSGTGQFPAEACGGVVTLRGNYTIAAAIEVFEGVTLDGGTKYATRIYNGNTGGDNAIEMLDSGRRSGSGVEFFMGAQNLTLVGNASSGTGLRIIAGADYGTYHNLLILSHGADGIYVYDPDTTTLGCDFVNVYSALNAGWGVCVGDRAATNTRNNNILSFRSCQFRENTLGGAFLFATNDVTMDHCLYESNTGVGLRIEGWGNVIFHPYFENNNSDGDQLELTTVGTTCYDNIVMYSKMALGIIHIEGADNNQIIGARSSTDSPNLTIDAGSNKNIITLTRNGLNSADVTDNGTNTVIWEYEDFHVDAIAGRTSNVGTAITSRNVIPGADDSWWLGQSGSPFAAYKGVIIKDTTDGKHYKITVINGTITATALD